MGCGKCGRWISRPQWKTTVLGLLPEDIAVWQHLTAVDEAATAAVLASAPVKYCICSTCSGIQEITSTLLVLQGTEECELLDKVGSKLHDLSQWAQKQIIERSKHAAEQA